MTNRELIVELSELPLDEEVRYYDDSNCLYEIFTINLDEDGSIIINEDIF